MTIPLEHLELMQEVLASQEAERLAAQLDWLPLAVACPPAKEWLEGDEPKPF